jgi:hypothetical protein
MQKARYAPLSVKEISKRCFAGTWTTGAALVAYNRVEMRDMKRCNGTAIVERKHDAKLGEEDWIVNGL